MNKLNAQAVPLPIIHIIGDIPSQLLCPDSVEQLMTRGLIRCQLLKQPKTPTESTRRKCIRLHRATKLIRVGVEENRVTSGKHPTGFVRLNVLF